MLLWLHHISSSLTSVMVASARAWFSCYTKYTSSILPATVFVCSSVPLFPHVRMLFGLRCCDQGGSTSDDAKRLLAQKLWGWLPFGIRWAEKTVSMEAVIPEPSNISETLCSSAVSSAGALQVSTCHAHSSRNGMMFARYELFERVRIGAIKIIRGVWDGEMWDSSAKESECAVFSAAIAFCTRRMDSLLWWILRVAGKRRARIVSMISGTLANSIVDLGIRQGLKVKYLAVCLRRHLGNYMKGPMRNPGSLASRWCFFCMFLFSLSSFIRIFSKLLMTCIFPFRTGHRSAGDRCRCCSKKG